MDPIPIYRNSIADAARITATPLNMTVACGALLGTGVTLSVDEASEALEDEASSGVEPLVVLSAVEALLVVSEVEDLVESLAAVGVTDCTIEDEVVSLMPQTSSTSKVNGMFLSAQFEVWRLRASRYYQIISCNSVLLTKKDGKNKRKFTYRERLNWGSSCSWPCNRSISHDTFAGCTYMLGHLCMNRLQSY